MNDLKDTLIRELEKINDNIAVEKLLTLILEDTKHTQSERVTTLEVIKELVLSTHLKILCANIIKEIEGG